MVVGRNQNPWAECRLDLLESEGGKLARRSTGGGAVYHDLGNLNYSFILPRKRYNMERQLAVIPVSYTHLDVYKRQEHGHVGGEEEGAVVEPLVPGQLVGVAGELPAADDQVVPAGGSASTPSSPAGTTWSSAARCV